MYRIPWVRHDGTLPYTSLFFLAEFHGHGRRCFRASFKNKKSKEPNLLQMLFYLPYQPLIIVRDKSYVLPTGSCSFWNLSLVL